MRICDRCKKEIKRGYDPAFYAKFYYKKLQNKEFCFSCIAKWTEIIKSTDKIIDKFIKKKYEEAIKKFMEK